MAAGGLWIGTSGWSYPAWRDRFYPRGLAAGRWLEHYATQFDAVELNASFYRLPERELVAHWAAVTPPPFRFAVKAWRALTHLHRLEPLPDLLEAFLARIEPLGAKLGPVLFQCPPHFPADPARLEAFLAILPEDLCPAFEFRDPSWHGDEIAAILERRGAAFVTFELAGSCSPRRVTGGRLYLRLHGHRYRYAGRYGPELLADWARWIEAERARGAEAWVFFDNTDLEAAAIEDARTLQRLLGAERG
ncbi:MAG: DUF72 domain-containing protein [Geminicoccaceae bacterium]|nr:DUF72 domain-containing protein [Geminicoccaceae bacterium]MCX8101502.1 DUF72 domain-containing protein [Geminicoccaceae bacterium]MDW8371817.1 DUF72 domain-containing protein [Geminicoccaceae bacterium]